MTRNLFFIVNRGRLHPSSRKRVYDLLVPLQQQGYRTKVVSYQWEWLWRLRSRSACGSVWARTLLREGNRLRLLRLLLAVRECVVQRRLKAGLQWADVTIVQQTFLDAKWLAAIKARGGQLVYDVDDALWMCNRDAFEKLGRAADGIVAGNEFIAENVGPLQRPVAVIPTCVSLCQRQSTSPARQSRQRFRIGWVGSPSTARSLSLLVRPLERLAEEIDVELVVVGTLSARLPTFRGVILRSHPKVPYDPKDFVPAFDVGVMPLEDGEWERGKCGAKALEYMAAGVPAVCSPAVAEIGVLTHEVTGLIAVSQEDWYRQLRRLASDRTLRGQLGRAGQAMVERRYSVDRAAKLWRRFLNCLCKSRLSSNDLDGASGHLAAASGSCP